MKEKKRDKSIVKEAIGDPAFYNDQINEKNEPVRAIMENKKGGKNNNGL